MAAGGGGTLVARETAAGEEGRPGEVVMGGREVMTPIARQSVVGGADTMVSLVGNANKDVKY